MADQLIGGNPAAEAGTGASAAPEQTIEQFMQERNPLSGAPQAVNQPESAPGEPPQTPEEPGSEPEGGSKAVRELIDQRKKRQEAERENAYLRGVLDTLVRGGQARAQAPQTPQATVQPPKRPVIEDFESYEQFDAAREKWMDNMVEFRANQVQQALVHRTTVDTVHQTFMNRIAEAEKTAPAIKDAFDVVGRALATVQSPGSDAVTNFVKLSPQGPQVLLFLHEHMDDTMRLARSNPYLAIAELGQIAGRLAAAKPANPPAQVPTQKSKAPPPVQPVVNNGAPVEVPLDKLDIGDFMKQRNKAQYGR